MVMCVLFTFLFQIFANEEDVRFNGSPNKATTSDPDVERVRR